MARAPSRAASRCQNGGPACLEKRPTIRTPVLKLTARPDEFRQAVKSDCRVHRSVFHAHDRYGEATQELSSCASLEYRACGPGHALMSYVGENRPGSGCRHFTRCASTGCRIAILRSGRGVEPCHRHALAAPNAPASFLKSMPAPLRQYSMRRSCSTETGCCAMRIRLGDRRKGQGG